MSVTQTAGRFDMGRVIELTFRAGFADFPAYLLLGILAYGLPVAALSLGSLTLLAQGSPFAVLVNLASSLLTVIASAAIAGGVMHGAMRRLNGQDVSLGQIFAAALRYFLPLVAIGLIKAIAEGLGIILFIIPGLLLMAAWSVAAPARVAEGSNSGGALSRSRDLTRGSRWPIFGLGVILTVATIMVSGVVSSASMMTGFTLALTPARIGFLIIGVLVSVVKAVMGSVGAAVVYSELRRVKEGVGVEQLAAIFD